MEYKQLAHFVDGAGRDRSALYGEQGRVLDLRLVVGRVGKECGWCDWKHRSKTKGGSECGMTTDVVQSSKMTANERVSGIKQCQMKSNEGGVLETTRTNNALRCNEDRKMK